MKLKIYDHNSRVYKEVEAVSRKLHCLAVWRINLADGQHTMQMLFELERDNPGWRDLPDLTPKPEPESMARSAVPTTEGQYLVCVFEWVGSGNEKPDHPRWVVRYYKSDRGWERQQYRWDTGGYENFEVVAWQPLPDLPAGY